MTVTGVNDAIIDGDQSTTVNVAMNAARDRRSALYDAIDPSDVTVTTTDDDFVIARRIRPSNAQGCAALDEHRGDDVGHGAGRDGHADDLSRAGRADRTHRR